ncbi:hypothetical protein LCGC14_0951750 [marine sediment metagenome]|uniref:Uncharacterized protein n=1 Tax=marine sediment metagenome TaxID=412755 RepID=A0A0F9NLS3_9ZZZZ
MTAGTAVTLGSGTSLTSKAAAWVLIQANSTNTGRIFVGDNSVSSSSFGVAVSAGDSLDMPPCHAPNVYNLDQIFIDAEDDNDSVTFIYEVV